MRTLAAGFAYFAIVFAIGFGLGTLRTLVLAPRLGEPLAVLIELPIMLIASWFACRRATARLKVPPDIAARIGMGIVAFALLMAAELALGAYVFGRSLNLLLADYGTLAGALGLAGQVVFAIFPALQRGYDLRRRSAGPR